MDQPTTLDTLIGQTVTVHKNLHKGLWSVTYAGKVVAHVHTVCIANATCHVSETARQRVIAKKCREVHARIKGTLVASPTVRTGFEITYNPYRSGSFTLRGGAPVARADFVFFGGDGIATALGDIA